MNIAEAIGLAFGLIGAGATITGGLWYLATKLTILNSELAQLRQSIIALTARVESLDAKHDDHAGRLARIETKLEASP